MMKIREKIWNEKMVTKNKSGNHNLIYIRLKDSGNHFLSFKYF